MQFCNESILSVNTTLLADIWLFHLYCRILPVDLEDKSLDISELLRDIRAKYTLAKNLLNIDNAVDQGDGKTLTTKIVDAPKSKTLSW